VRGMSLLRSILALLTLTCLNACGWGDPGFIRPGDYECDAAEAMVRHLFATAPDLDPQVPNEYCVVKLRAPTAVDSDFSKRFADLGKPFLSADGMSFKDELGFPVNPKSGLAPTVLHLVHMHKETDGSYQIEAAWAYKQAFERHLYKVAQVDGKWHVTSLQKLAEGK
jgi:hypothetical protein